jgi:2-dehydro-3-deoxyphosphooctonate aldolase (KDO 8-P synthase)
MKRVEITGDLAAGPDAPLLLIAGPCVIEGRDFTLKMAEAIQEVCATRDVGLVFKSSFDKANRSSVDSYRGPGLDEGLQILADVRAQTGLPLLTDIHDASQAAPAGEVVDVLQIPAFLARQTDLLLAAAGTGKVVNVKKAQFLSPAEMGNVVRKLEAGGTERILVTERGTTFGYNTLVVDFRSLPQLADLGYPVVFDGTHSVQMPGGLGTASGGQREYVPHLVRAAAAVGVQALFLEVHADPSNALSDGPNQLPTEALGPVLDQVLAVREALAGLPSAGV